MKATIRMNFRVCTDDAALNTVRLYSGLMLETTRFGKIATPKRKLSAAIVQADDTNAYAGRPRRIARGMLAIARMFRRTTIHASGHSAKCRVTSGLMRLV